LSNLALIRKGFGRELKAVFFRHTAFVFEVKTTQLYWDHGRHIQAIERLFPKVREVEIIGARKVRKQPLEREQEITEKRARLKTRVDSGRRLSMYLLPGPDLCKAYSAGKLLLGSKLDTGLEFVAEVRPQKDDPWKWDNLREWDFESILNPFRHRFECIVDGTAC
jgi:hypothetical protein